MDQEVTITRLPNGDLPALFPKERDVALATFTGPGMIQPYLDHVRREIDGFSADVNTPRGRRDISSFAFKITKSKTFLDGVGKELVADLKEIPKKIDATRKLVRDTLDAWADEVRKPLTEWEKAEEARIETHKQIIARITARSLYLESATAAMLKDALMQTEAEEVTPDACEEFLAEYQRARDNAATILRSMIPLREQAEADAAELAKLRAEAKAREERDRFEAEMIERQRIEKERAEKAREEEARRHVIAAQAAIQAEADRVEREARLVREAEERVAREASEAKARAAAAEAQRARDEEHRKMIHEDIRNDMWDFVGDADAIDRLIEAISAGIISHVTITY
jgi:chromosome segregation ATPase